MDEKITNVSRENIFYGYKWDSGWECVCQVGWKEEWREQEG